MHLLRFIKFQHLLLMVTFLSLVAGVTHAEEDKSYKVIKIIDGRTIKVKSQDLPSIVTLAGIEETTKEGKRYLFKTLLNKKVTIHVIRSKSDHVSAHVVRTKDDLFINEQLLRNGFAKYKKCSKRELNARMAKAQAMAQEAGLGVWKQTDSKPQTPNIKKQSSRAPPKADIVYITKTGKKYHREHCRYLNRSKIPIKRKDAVQYYGACKVCRP